MEWWTNQQAGLVGGLLGAGVGGILLGAIGGGVCGPLAGKGIGKSFVIAYAWFVAVLGVVILAAGIYALAVGQPFHVWFWLFHPGMLATLLGIGGVFLFRKIYARHEQRRLAAEELRRG